MARLTLAVTLGAVLGYFGGALLGCVVLMPSSSLCGLPGALFGVPVGATMGGALASRRRR